MIKFDQYQSIFTIKAKKAGYSEDDLLKCLEYAKPLLIRGIPVIFNTSNLAALVGYNRNYLKRAVAYPKYFYKQHKIPKLSGGFRLLYEPLPSLKEIQSSIANDILGNIPLSRYAKAYISERSIKDHVRFHKGQKMLVTLDIEDFFGSINISQVNQLFLDLGYSKLVANLLAKLTCFKGSLPQGAPSSPSISNIILKPFDDFISEYCRKKELRYTRYADDLAFSGEEIDSEELEKLVSEKLASFGDLRLNKSKTLIMKNTQRQVISGIIVNSKVQVTREKRDQIRQAMYYIEKFGLEDHLNKINCTKANYLKHLLGVANYISFINPKDEKMKAIKEKLYKMIAE